MTRHIAGATLRRGQQLPSPIDLEVSSVGEKGRYLDTCFHTKSLPAQATFRISGNRHNRQGASSVCRLCYGVAELATAIGSQTNHFAEAHP